MRPEQDEWRDRAGGIKEKIEKWKEKTKWREIGTQKRSAESML